MPQLAPLQWLYIFIGFLSVIGLVLVLFFWSFPADYVSLRTMGKKTGFDPGIKRFGESSYMSVLRASRKLNSK